MRMIIAVMVAAAAVIVAIFVAPRIHDDVRVEAAIVVMVFAAVLALVAWAMKPP